MIENVLLKYPGYKFSSYSHIFLSARNDIDSNKLDCNAVLSWVDIADLSSDVLGENHYVTMQLVKSNNLYNAVKGAWKISDRKKNYYGKKSILEIIHTCTVDGSKLQIGYKGGTNKLKKLSLHELKEYNFKWDRVEHPIGKKVPKNWILSEELLEMINSHFPSLKIK